MIQDSVIFVNIPTIYAYFVIKRMSTFKNENEDKNDDMSTFKNENK